MSASSDIINNETYDEYMDEISELMCKAYLTERESCRLGEMVDAVTAYEEFHWPMDPPTPEELEEFRRDQGIK